MPGIIVVGAQWGDEGKGKISDLLNEDIDVGYRYNGGPNAGHTIHNQYGEITLRTIPAAILNPDAMAIIGGGVVVDFDSLIAEINKLEKLGVCLDSRLKISLSANLIAPWHIAEEREKESGEDAIGTTGKGIGPCQKDRVGRYDALLVIDCLNKNFFLDKLYKLYRKRRQYFLWLYGDSVALPPFDKIQKSMLEGRERVLPFIEDAVKLVRKAVRNKKRILLEGAQGTYLDLNDGTFPYVTSTHTTSMAACKLSGIQPSEIERVILVVKAYPTRVGNGPFPTELMDDLGIRLRELGREYGSVTRRPRRCGWPDFFLVRDSCQINDIGRPMEISLTKIDVLFQLERIRIATGYEGVEEIGEMERLQMSKMKAVYGEEFLGCGGIENVRFRDELPSEPRRFIGLLQNYIKVPVRYISTGPKRKEIITI